jgi:hypothetical protein
MTALSGPVIAGCISPVIAFLTHKLMRWYVHVSFAITVGSRFFWRTISSITRSGVPTAMKPPTMRLAPSGIMSTD